MRGRLHRAVVIGLALLAAGCATVQPAAQQTPAATATAEPPPLLILLSIDGFRADYLDRGLTPNLARLAAGGAQAPAMRPAFPSVTFPNHYTLVTGVPPGVHGIVNNRMEDLTIPGATFTLGDPSAVTDRRWWDDAEPIWVTAEKQGVRTATMFWPGSEAAIRGVRPTDWLQFNGRMPSDARVEQVFSWLDRPAAERPRFITLYLQKTDDIGHSHGPDSAELNAAIRETDAAVGQLVAGLSTRGVAANLLIVSDHGMAQVDHVVRLDQIADAADFRLVYGGAIANIVAQPGRAAALETALLRPHDSGMQCWKKGQLPARFHYNDHRRITDFTCMARVGGMIADREPTRLPAGMHGYDPESPEMAAIFIAHGPDIPAGTRLPVMDATDVHPWLIRLLRLEEMPADR